MKIIILTLLLSAIFSGESLPPPPELLPECISEYVLIWEFDNHRYCQDYHPYGDYYLYSCYIRKWSEFHQIYYKTIKHDGLEFDCYREEI